jgi:Flp pilus assembly pilin Flp
MDKLFAKDEGAASAIEYSIITMGVLAAVITVAFVHFL